MPAFRIEIMPSRKSDSDKAVYYVKDTQTNRLVTKFDTNTTAASEVAGFDNMSAGEQLELQNYIDNMRFFVELGFKAKENKNYRLFAPESLQQDTLPTLAAYAIKNNIPFHPMRAALHGFYNHIKTTVKRVKALEGEAVIDELGLAQLVELSDVKKDEMTAVKKASKKIFKALLKQSHYLENYAEVASKVFHKETNVNTATITRYADGKAKPSQWSISCALFVLGKSQYPIFEKLPCDMVVTLWLTPLKFLGLLSDAKGAQGLFVKTFKLSEEKRGEACLIIDKVL